MGKTFLNIIYIVYVHCALFQIKSIFTKTKAIIHFKKDNKLNTKPLFKPRKAKKNIKNINE